MMNRKEQRLRRARQTRLRIARQGVVRLCVHRSNKHIYASLISGDGAQVLATVSTAQKSVAAQLAGTGGGSNKAAAELVGRLIAAAAKQKGVEGLVAFDRSGFAYHGRVAALAEAARGAGLNLGQAKTTVKEES